MRSAEVGEKIQVEKDELQVRPERKILLGHVTQETAYVQHDYPFGRFHRCPMLYWIERAIKGAKKGEYRYMRMSPKKEWCQGYTEAVDSGDNNHVLYYQQNPPFGWNKAKASTYHFWAGMVLTPATDGNGDVIQKDGINVLGPSYVALEMYGSPKSWFNVRCNIRNQYMTVLEEYGQGLPDLVHEPDIGHARDKVQAILNNHSILQAFNGERNLWAVEQYLRKQGYYQDWFNDFDSKISFSRGSGGSIALHQED